MTHSQRAVLEYAYARAYRAAYGKAPYHSELRTMTASELLRETYTLNNRTLLNA